MKAKQPAFLLLTPPTFTVGSSQECAANQRIDFPITERRWRTVVDDRSPTGVTDG